MRRVFILLPALCAACAPLAPAPTKPVAYACDGGRGFSVAYHAAGDAATIEIERMRFLLAADAEQPAGRRYTCSELVLWREDDGARLEWAGGQPYLNCRVLP
jgi:membrane-bound inhibitor of C-type lysozyme